MKLEAMRYGIDELEAMDTEDRLVAGWEIPAGLLLLEDIQDQGFADFASSTPDFVEAEDIADKTAMRKSLHTAAIRETLMSFGIDSAAPLAKQIRTLGFAKQVARALGNEVASELGSLEIVDTKVIQDRGRKATKVRVVMAYGGTFWVFDSKPKAKTSKRK
jgi:hypothetical protein